MVFKRYSSPFLFLDNLILSNKLTVGINAIYRNANEDKLWNLYLATLPLNEKSYNDWKNDNKVSNQEDEVENIVDIETTKKQALEILKNTRPE